MNHPSRYVEGMFDEPFEAATYTSNPLFSQHFYETDAAAASCADIRWSCIGRSGRPAWRGAIRAGAVGESGTTRRCGGDSRTRSASR